MKPQPASAVATAPSGKAMLKAEGAAGASGEARGGEAAGSHVDSSAATAQLTASVASALIMVCNHFSPIWSSPCSQPASTRPRAGPALARLHLRAPQHTSCVSVVLWSLVLTCALRSCCSLLACPGLLPPRLSRAPRRARQLPPASRSGATDWRGAPALPRSQTCWRRAALQVEKT